MRIKKLIITLLSVVLAIANCLPTMANELEVYESSAIPESMQSNTVILFKDKTHFVILEGGFSNTENMQKILLEQKSAEEKQLENECKSNGAYYTANDEDYPIPVEGMKVTYGTDGLLSRIEGIKDNVLDSHSISKSSISTVKKAATSAKKKLIAQWGTNNYNKLYKSGTNIIGYGRATTYNDTKGQRGNKLKKGDVATKLKYDNCKYGIAVKVKARTKGSTNKATHTMHKRDVGGMPNAIVDIWKTGVEYWGYKYSANLSIPGKTKIVHENK